MSQREDWFGLEDDPAVSPAELRPDTDEFGRDDPAAIERERRRREREERRRQSRGRREQPPKGKRGGFFDRLLGREKPSSERPRSRRTEPPPAEAQPAAPDPTQARPTETEPTEPEPTETESTEPESTEPEAPQPGLTAARPEATATRRVSRAAGARAAQGRTALRRRISRGEAATAEGLNAHRRRRSRAGEGGRYGRRRVAAVILGLLGILMVWFLVALFQPFAGDGRGEGEVIINVPEQATASEVADLLSEEGVVSNGTLFELRLRLSGKSDSILPGRYVMAGGMSYGAAIDQLTRESSEGLVTLTIPEGDARRQTASLIAETGITGNYVKASRSFRGFNPAKYGAPRNPPSLEGFLFPATYELEPGASVQTLIAEQLQAFEQNISQVNMSYAKRKNLNVYDVLKIASMVDDEAQDPKERRLIAAVIYNRLRRDQPLGIDATTRYQFNNYTEPVTQSQLQSNSGYNTRRNVGLPPTPISNPGLDAIRAAANPARVNYLFFVVKPGTGCPIQHSFTASEQEFERLQAEYQQALQEQGGSPTADC